jgi:hypothetical protein
MDVFCTELGIWLSFVKSLEFPGGGTPLPISVKPETPIGAAAILNMDI